MSADEIFEELGYEKEEDECYITYRNKYFYSDIVFEKGDKKFYKCECFREYEYISMQELKAINKKCLEFRLDKQGELNMKEIWKDIPRI